ncbi:MAG: hypothetical protein ACYTG0_21965 [Planctomycetota bacterium]|jgi:hypothetical protein
MSTNQETPKIPLPKGWKQHVRSAVLQVISLAGTPPCTPAVGLRIPPVATRRHQGPRFKLVVTEFELLEQRLSEYRIARRPEAVRENGPKSVVDCVRN